MLLLRPRIQPQHDCRARTCEHNQHCQHNQQNPSRSSHVPFSIQAELPPSLCEILYQFSRQLQPKAPIYPALLQLQRPRGGGRLCPPGKICFRNAKPIGESEGSQGLAESPAPTQCGRISGQRRLPHVVLKHAQRPQALPAAVSAIWEFLMRRRSRTHPAAFSCRQRWD